MKKENVFEGSSVQDAIEKGLAALGITEEEAEIRVKSKGGFFTKPSVEITVKEKVEEEVAEEGAAPVAEELEEEIAEESVKAALTEEECAAAEERVRAFIDGLLGEMRLDCTAEVTREGEDIDVRISGKGAGSIIGYRGDVLDAVQYMALWIANNSVKEFIRVSLDAENYRKKRNETLTNLAMRLARKAARTGRRVSLEAMNPFERRVIHTALQGDKFVRTESEGEGSYRHVVIIPKNENAPKARRPRETSYGETPQMTYGTSAKFRKKGAVKTKTYGAPCKKPY